MEKVLTLSLCLGIKTLGCDDSLHLGQNGSFRWQNLCFVQCGAASTLRGTQQAHDTHVLEELIFNQVELHVRHVLGRRGRAGEL